MNGQAQHFLAPPNGLWVERFAHAGDKTQVGKLVALRQFGAGFHEQANGRGGGVPDADALVLQQGVPALGVKFFAVHQRGHAVQQRRQDAVGGASDPAGVGGAPEAVLRVQVQRVATRGVVGNGRAVHMQGAFGRAGGAAGEVQQCGAVGGGGGGGEVV